MNTLRCWEGGPKRARKPCTPPPYVALCISSVGSSSVVGFIINQQLQVSCLPEFGGNFSELDSWLVRSQLVQDLLLVSAVGR